jgi:hypothetical protein
MEDYCHVRDRVRAIDRDGSGAVMADSSHRSIFLVRGGHQEDGRRFFSHER